ncbi:uncharacterized protein CIMG_12610 [Coccidioides immitis RS]|uniref:Uncharacterized protein n=1 Tax=Coccidioides immitis (strain RS) TaxID=246410 RepID=J3KMD2_COCIM|nr:uncharacterized protein CIMG_12610 [Coccidioides immitis RS]EAS37559.3 hypothetical protein CIMG_12610 [Coccidioides immitis RS]
MLSRSMRLVVMNVSDLRVKLYRMFLNAYKLFEINKQKNNNHIFAKSFLTNDIGTLNNSTLRLVDIENIDLEHIHNLTNEMSDIDGDRDNEADGDNRDDRDNKDDGDDRKSSPHVLENTEHKKARK